MIAGIQKNGTRIIKIKKRNGIKTIVYDIDGKIATMDKLYLKLTAFCIAIGLWCIAALLYYYMPDIISAITSLINIARS